MGGPAGRSSSAGSRARRLRQGSSDLAGERLYPLQAGSRSSRPSAGPDGGDGVFRRRSAAVERRRARAARAKADIGHVDEAIAAIRELWRDGNFDSWTESLILREFGGCF